MLEKEIYLFEKYPITQLLRLVNKAIEDGSDDFSICEEDDGYGNKETFLRFHPR